MSTTNQADRLVGLELDPDDELICVLLSQGWTHTQAANQVGCSAKTVQRRMADPEFAAEVRRRRRADVAATTARLIQLGRSATDRLTQLLNAEDERVRLQTAKAVLELGHRRYRVEVLQDELTERVAILEEAQAKVDGESGEGPA